MLGTTEFPEEDEFAPGFGAVDIISDFDSECSLCALAWDEDVRGVSPEDADDNGNARVAEELDPESEPMWGAHNAGEDSQDRVQGAERANGGDGDRVGPELFEYGGEDAESRLMCALSEVSQYARDLEFRHRLSGVDARDQLALAFLRELFRYPPDGMQVRIRNEAMAGSRQAMVIAEHHAAWISGYQVLEERGHQPADRMRHLMQSYVYGCAGFLWPDHGHVAPDEHDVSNFVGRAQYGIFGPRDAPPEPDPTTPPA